MAQTDDVKNCTTLNNPVDMINCIRKSLGYTPIAPATGTVTTPTACPDTGQIKIVGQCISKKRLLIGGVITVGLLVILSSK